MYDYRLKVTQGARLVLDTATPLVEWVRAVDRGALTEAVTELLLMLDVSDAGPMARTLVQRAFTRRSYRSPVSAEVTVGGYDVALAIAPSQAPHRLSGIRAGFELWATTLLGEDVQRRFIASTGDRTYPCAVGCLVAALEKGAAWASREIYAAAAAQQLQCSVVSGLSAETLGRKASVLSVQISRRKMRGTPGVGYSDIPISVKLSAAGERAWIEQYALHVDVIAQGATGYDGLPATKEDF